MSRARHKKMASGGKTAASGGEHKYNAEGTPAMKEDEDKKESFKKGGAVKLKRGGKVHGMKPKHRADKRPRRAEGGKVAGRSPLSSAAGSKGRPGGDYTDHADSHDD